jgi:twitching motility protein PilT
MGGLSELEALLAEARARGASDLHLAPGAAPHLRLEGELVALPGPPLDGDEVLALCGPVLAQADAGAAADLCVAFDTAAAGRFRASVFRRAGALGAVFRAIPTTAPTAEALGLPASVIELSERGRGLVLVTGPAGSGRTTTLAALVGAIGARAQRHIVTFEDPIEHVHAHAGGLVSQRELGRDVPSVAAGVRAALRHDPDVLVIGEVADADAADAALEAAEAGRLCLAATRGASVLSALASFIDLFPAHRQAAARARLASVLEGALGQRLLPRAGGGERVMALELLVPGAPDRALIRDDNLPSIHAHMQAGHGGAQTLNSALADLYLARRVTLEAAIGHSADATELQQLIAARGQPPPRRASTGAYPTTRRS